MNKTSFIDLFAGCGGLSLGLLQSGWQGVAAVERDKYAFSTLSENLIDGDPKRCIQYQWPAALPRSPMTIADFKNTLQTQPRLLQELGRVDMVVGSPPCQGFSFAGRRDAADPRNQSPLTMDSMRLARHTNRVKEYFQKLIDYARSEKTQRRCHEAR